MLIKHGANIDIGDESWTPIDAALLGNHTEIVRLLLDSGCNLDDFDLDSRLINARRRDGRSIDESKKMISDEIEDRKVRKAFDSFISYHIEYKPYKDMIYSICYQNLKISKPDVGWENAIQVRDKYYFDEVFFYIHLYVGLNYTSSKNFSVLIETANSMNSACTLMTVITARLKLYLKPI